MRGGDHRAISGLELFAKIFHVDAESKRAGESSAQRFERRQRDSAPLVAELKCWVRERRQDVEPKSALGKAVRYLNRQWSRLTAFLRDPQMELTNNEVEAGLRGELDALLQQHAADLPEDAIIHLANTYGTLRHAGYHHTLVRPGLEQPGAEVADV